MLCQNCGENEANVRYTQIINGVKEQVSLCEKCAKKLGIEDIDFNIPINFSSAFDDMIEMYNDMIPSFMNLKTVTCSKDDRLYRDLKEDKENEFSTTFNLKIDSLLKNTCDDSKKIKKEKTELEKLKERLEIEIKEERYEDAAKTRDEIKKIEK